MGGWDTDFRRMMPEEEMAIDNAAIYPYHSFKDLVQLMGSGGIRVPNGVSHWRFAAMIRQKINVHMYAKEEG